MHDGSGRGPVGGGEARPGGRRRRRWGAPSWASRRRVGWVVAAIALVVLVAGVLGGPGASSKFSAVGTAIGAGGGSDSAETSAADAPAALDGSAGETMAASPSDADAGADGGGGASGAVTADGTTADLVAQGPLAGSGRQIISTAEMTVAVDDVGASVGRAVDAAVAAGAVLYGQDSALERDPRATLTFKVAPEGFAALQDRLAELGALRSQRVTTDDVTEQVVDLEARIATSRASVERIRALISEATNVMDIASLEGELLRRETELESLEGQLRTLSERVDLATVVLVLVEPAPGVLVDDPDAVPAVVVGGDQPGFATGLRAGVDALVGALQLVLVVAGALAPFLPLVVVGLVVRWAVLRHRRPVVSPAGPAGP